MSRNPRSRSRAAAAAPLAWLALAACASERLVDTRPEGAGPLALELSTARAVPGDTVTLTLAIAPGTLAALQGRLAYPAARLRYLGQDAARPEITLLREEAPGRLVVVSLQPGGLSPRPVVLGFEVLAERYAGELRFEPEVLAAADGATLRPGPALTARDTGPATPGTAFTRLDLAGWNRRHAPGLADDAGGPGALAPGAYVPNLRYGDATLSGAINVLDASYLANVAVGNNPLIAGTDAPGRDAVVAGNVRPTNGAGLGEASDPLPPGVEGDGSRVVNVLDALAVANEAVGIDQAIVGELIPGRGAVPTASAVLTGDLTASRTLRRDTVYQLSGMVRVLNGATLTIEAGTRIEGTSFSQLAITRDGRIDARGTPLEPIVMSCPGFSGIPCWDGLLLQGHAPVLGDDFSSPPARGNGSAGCAQYVTSAGAFGGCDPADSSGILRYLRIEGAQFALHLQGVGSGTIVDFVQGHGGSYGFQLDGGSARLKHLVVSGNNGVGLDWDLSWTGSLQFGLLSGGINAQNTGGTGPFGVPTLYNLALIPNVYGWNGITIRGGAFGWFVNALTLGGTVPLVPLSSVALSIWHNASCQDIGGPGAFLSYHHSLWAGMTVGGDPDSDPTPCAGGYSSPTVESEWFLDPVNANQSVPGTAGLMLDPFNPNLPDFRPAPGSLLLSMPAATPPADGFLDPTATYIGAVPPTSAAGIPWYSGWTTPAATGPVPAGTISGTVTSPEAGPLAGVTVTGAGTSTVTDQAGGYTLPAAAGVATVSVSGYPATCSATGPQQVVVPGGAVVPASFTLACPVPAGAFAVDITLAGGLATVRRVERPGSRLRPYSLLGSDAVAIGVSNVFASTVGQFTPGKVRVWFDLTLSGVLNGVSLGTPTFPAPPTGQTGVFVFPYAATGLTSSGGVVVVQPNTGLIVASVDWNGNGAPDQPAPPVPPGAGGDPWSWFNDPVCSGGSSGGGDCYRYETYPVIPVLGTTAPRRVGFDLDPSIGQFRAYLVVAADVLQP